MYFLAKNENNTVCLMCGDPIKAEEGFWITEDGTAIKLSVTNGDIGFFKWWDGNPIEVELSETDVDIVFPLFVVKDKNGCDGHKVNIFSVKPQRYYSLGIWGIPQLVNEGCRMFGDDSEFPDLEWSSKPLLFEGLKIPKWREEKVKRQVLYHQKNSFYGNFGLDSYEQLVAEIKKMQEERTGEVINPNIKSPFDRQPLSEDIVELLQQTYYGLLWMEKFSNPPMGTTLERAVGGIPALREEINTLISKNRQQDKDETQEE